MKKNIALGIASAAVLAPSLAMADVNQPQEIIDRPRTTPAGQITVGADIISLITVDGTPTGLGLSGKYGVNDKLEVGAMYGFSLKEFEIKGDLNIGAAYSLLNAGNLTMSADVMLGYDLLAEGLNPLVAGLEAQYKLGPQMAVYMPGTHLSVALDGDPKPITFGLPVGFAYQAAPNIHAFAQTELARLSISNSSTVIFGADYIPLTIGAWFSPSNTMDFGAALNWFDLKELSGDPYISLHARLHM